METKPKTDLLNGFFGDLGGAIPIELKRDGKKK